MAWQDDDQDAALAWLLEQRERCSGCGHPLDETTDDAARLEWRADSVVCHACAVQDGAAHNIRTSETHTAGLRVWVERHR